MKNRMTNAMTIDVEDWYHDNLLKLDRGSWDRLESNVIANTEQVLELLGEQGVRATFFILGCVAKAHPSLVKKIAASGHEIGVHGYWHTLVSQQTRAEFSQELHLTRDILQELTGQGVALYRAPSWSVSRQTLWVLEELEQEGFVCDSSIQPFATPLSGVTGAPVAPFHPIVNGRRLALVEFPPTVLNLGLLRIPFAGGFYLRLMPSWICHQAMRLVNNTRPGLVYTHPWEYAAERPALPLGLINFAQQHSAKTTKTKLRSLLDQFAFAPLGTVIADHRFPAASLHRNDQPRS